MKQALLMFVKNIAEGKVKTRLAATIGHAAALSVYRHLLVHTEKCTYNLLANKIVFYSDHPEVDDIWSEAFYHKQIQAGHDLGERMQNAFEYAFTQGNDRVAIIGSDCFELSSEIMETAFKKLDHYDVVLGPALDGGYYLLALKSLHKEIFQNIEWSTDRVLTQTLQACRQLGLSTIKLQPLSDIDNETDLKRARYNK